MKKLIIVASIFLMVCGLWSQSLAQTHNSKMDPWGFTQTARNLWTIDVQEYLKDVVSLTVRDTLFEDTLISDTIDVHLMFSAPYLLNILDTTGLTGTFVDDTVIVEMRKQYWDNGPWTSYAYLDTIFSGEQTGSSFQSTAVLWGSETKPWGVQFQFIAEGTTRVKHSRICGGQ